MVRKGVIETEQQKARFWELKMLDHLGETSIDLSGKDFHSPCEMPKRSDIRHAREILTASY